MEVFPSHRVDEPLVPQRRASGDGRVRVARSFGVAGGSAVVAGVGDTGSRGTPAGADDGAASHGGVPSAGRKGDDDFAVVPERTRRNIRASSVSPGFRPGARAREPGTPRRRRDRGGARGGARHRRARIFRAHVRCVRSLGIVTLEKMDDSRRRLGRSDCALKISAGRDAGDARRESRRTHKERTRAYTHPDTARLTENVTTF